ncbi:uncharacterized protein DNG_07786 [Cephalotrichum gorgonifer]|uniref:Methyltransferase domain-containing protein n=1 Tax=Cephalotrichum gorgonifer TaxID=2041049 RepID=A0AAE8SXR2_9PEZI|nr:uncharacterized protein DNG_07786 [Cephalotrichum gorgonifer]
MAQPAQSLSDINRDYWDEKAATTFKHEWVKVLSKQLTRTLREFAPLLVPSRDGQRSSPIRMLDYACGNGLASWAMIPYVDVIRGIDIAPGMVTQYNQRVLESEIPEGVMFAHEGDLLAPTDSIATDELHGFDLAITSMALHHFSDPEAAISALVARLKPGGTVAVVDWASGGDKMPWGKGEGAAKHDAKHTCHEKSGEFLSWESLLPMLGRAGCDMATAYYAIIGEKSYMPEEATKVPGGVHANGFLAFAKRKAE